MIGSIAGSAGRLLFWCLVPGDGLGGEVGLAGEVVVGGLVGPGGGAQPGRRGRAGVGELGQAGAEQVVVGVGEQQRVVQSGVGDLVAAGVRGAGGGAGFAGGGRGVCHFSRGGGLSGGFAGGGGEGGEGAGRGGARRQARGGAVTA